MDTLPPAGPLRVLALETALETALEGAHPDVSRAVRSLARCDQGVSERTVNRRTRAALAVGASADLIRLALGGPA